MASSSVSSLTYLPCAPVKLLCVTRGNVASSSVSSLTYLPCVPVKLLCVTLNDNRVRDHDHYTGKYEGGAHQFCNVKAFQMFKGKTNIPIANYDIKCFMDAFQKLEGDDAVINNIGGIPCNMEIFKSININSYSIIDSYAHLFSSLDKFIKNLPSEKKVLLRTLASNDEEFTLINKKGFYT